MEGASSIGLEDVRPTSIDAVFVWIQNPTGLSRGSLSKLIFLE